MGTSGCRGVQKFSPETRWSSSLVPEPFRKFVASSGRDVNAIQCSLYGLGRLLLLRVWFCSLRRGWQPEVQDELADYGQLDAFLWTSLFALVCGFALQWFFRSGRDAQGVREGFAIVVLGWLAICALGAIPLCVWLMEHEGYSIFRAFTDGYFEAMSGLSTTGATILFDIEAVPRSILLWRALTHWLGGMGIITLAIAIFPAMGVAGYQMFRGEVAGPSADRLTPRLAESAKVLWMVYVSLTAVMSVLLFVSGLDWFDSICHAFATLATGGFSTRNGSVAAYGNPAVEWIIILFMFLAGVNFLLHYQVVTRRDFRIAFRNRELRFYVWVVLGASAFLILMLSGNGMESPEVAYQNYRFEPGSPDEFANYVAAEAERFNSVESSVRHAVFQVLAIVTTTGFGTADFDVWPRSVAFLLVVLMFFGACAGSTSGGMKLIRIMVAGKAWR